MNRIGIICYSRSGTGRMVAQQLEKLGNWPVHQIQDERPRVGLKGDIRCMMDILARRLPAIVYEGPTLDSFDHVILIAPVWLRSIAAPMRTFLRREGAGLREYSVICVFSGYGGLRAVDDIVTILKVKPRFILLLKQYEVLAEECDEALFRLKEHFDQGWDIDTAPQEISIVS